MPDHPLILLTLRGRPQDASRRDPTPFPFEWLENDYARLIAGAGGTPIFVSNECPADRVKAIVDRCDGLLLTGGEDVHPRYFNEEAGTDFKLYLNDQRDAVEFAAITAADERALPILGICRGIQVLNVARGGTLYQDLPEQYKDGKLRDHTRGEPGLVVQAHEVELTESCRVSHLLGKSKLKGATSHHQAIRNLGKGLKAVGHSPEDGVIEAVEEDGNRFVVGVQWHPERRSDDEETIKLFTAFVDACREHARMRNAIA